MVVRVEIDLGALRTNYRRLKACKPSSGECFAVVKCNAYGHGLLPVARALDSEGVDGFAVTDVNEAISLRDAGIERPIMVMSERPNSQTLTHCRDRRLELVLGDITAVSEVARFHLPRVWIKINTGMNRFGIHPDDLASAVDRLSSNRIQPLGLMTHLACANDLNDNSAEEQLNLFRHLSARYDFPSSVMNSAGYLRWQEAIDDRARCGIAVYGSNPIKPANGDPPVSLLPVMTVRSSVLMVQNKPVGQRVGYQLRDRIEPGHRYAVISAGYSDGYPYPGRTKTPVLINGQRYGLLGKTSMNMLVAEIGHDAVAPNDEVILWGRGLPVDEVAEANDLISYQLMSVVQTTHERLYLNSVGHTSG